MQNTSDGQGQGLLETLNAHRRLGRRARRATTARSSRWRATRRITCRGGSAASPPIDFASLEQSGAHNPLLNRATQGQYAPGSTFKLVPLDRDDQLRRPRRRASTINDKGSVHARAAPTFKNDNGERNGSVDLQQALTVSSDVYFYTAGDDFWDIWKAATSSAASASSTVASELGFGKTTGIELDEADGRIPDPAWKTRVREGELQDAAAGAPPERRSGIPATTSTPRSARATTVVTPLQLAERVRDVRERRHAVDAARRARRDRPDDEERRARRTRRSRAARSRSTRRRAQMMRGLRRRRGRSEGHRVPGVPGLPGRSRCASPARPARPTCRARARRRCSPRTSPIANPQYVGRRGRRGRRPRRADRGADRRARSSRRSTTSRSRRSLPATGRRARTDGRHHRTRPRVAADRAPTRASSRHLDLALLALAPRDQRARAADDLRRVAERDAARWAVAAVLRRAPERRGRDRHRSRWCVIMAIDYRRIRDVWPLVYIAIAPAPRRRASSLGRNHNGAQAWFQVGPFQFQPSEIAKIVRDRRDRAAIAISIAVISTRGGSRSRSRSPGS